jgi:hypothetical protein
MSTTVQETPLQLPTHIPTTLVVTTTDVTAAEVEEKTKNPSYYDGSVELATETPVTVKRLEAVCARCQRRPGNRLSRGNILCPLTRPCLYLPLVVVVVVVYARFSKPKIPKRLYIA